EESLGTNAKVSTLIQLQRLAKHDVVIVSDADVRVPPDFLVNAVAPLKDSTVGLVNCFYRLANPATSAMQWEAVAINSDFWSQVLQSASLKPIDFALGAVMVTRRKQLDEIGGFASLADFLADDYRLGNLIAQKGHRIALCPVVVECWSAPMNWREVWAHQLRWARTIRVCQPLPYFSSIISNATIWPLLWSLASVPFATVKSSALSENASEALAQAFICSLLATMLCVTTRIGLALHLQFKLNRGTGHFMWWWLVPVKDLLNAVIWALAFFGNRVEWRGHHYRVESGGKLVKV
ncbi:MAG TPA: glycosyltransferase, partial [Candidatus Eisenbacteria bacterium]|nr:glycosyltransferase [Candidatus Eisenbacteria bacterium]